MRSVMSLALVAMCAGAAWGEGEKRDYPELIVDRPMVLPTLMFSPQLEVSMTNYSPAPAAGMPQQSAQGALLGFGLDVGLARRVQAGFYFNFPLAPVADFGDFDANLQINLVPRALNFRFDVGAERAVAKITLFGVQVTGASNSALIGFGLPLKIRIARFLAFVSGSNTARNYSRPVVIAAGNGDGIFAGGVFSDDILMLQPVNPSGSPAGLEGAFTIPVGLVLQPVTPLAIGVRTGYRLIFTYQPQPMMNPVTVGTTSITHTVPLAFDLTIALRVIDIGFTATIYGPITTSGFTASGVSAPVGDRWASVQRYDLWFGARF